MRQESLSLVLAGLSSLLAFDAVAQAPPKPIIETPAEGDQAITGTYSLPATPQADSTEPGGQSGSGRLRTEFTFGFILSKEREEFSQTDLYLDFSLDATWRQPESDSSNWHWLFNTFFAVRLTSIPVVVDTGTETPEPADPPDETDSISSFIASKKGVLMQLGFYAPWYRESWTWPDEGDSGETNALFFAPLVKFGFQSITEEIKTIRDDPDDLFESRAVGVRFGHLKYQGDTGDGIELVSYLDLTFGKWENFEVCVGKVKQPTPTSCGDAPAGGTKVSNFRTGIEGRLKIDSTVPIILGIDINTGRDRDDVRFIVGTRFNVATLIEKLSG